MAYTALKKMRRNYEGLSDLDKDKERLPFNSMLQLVRKFDGLRIYQFSNESHDGSDEQSTGE